MDVRDSLKTWARGSEAATKDTHTPQVKSHFVSWKHARAVNIRTIQPVSHTQTHFCLFLSTFRSVSLSTCLPLCMYIGRTYITRHFRMAKTAWKCLNWYQPYIERSKHCSGMYLKISFTTDSTNALVTWQTDVWGERPGWWSYVFR